MYYKMMITRHDAFQKVVLFLSTYKTPSDVHSCVFCAVTSNAEEEITVHALLEMLQRSNATAIGHIIF